MGSLVVMMRPLNVSALSSHYVLRPAFSGILGKISSFLCKLPIAGSSVEQSINVGDISGATNFSPHA